MRKDKEYIFKLRQEGKTFRAIEKETGVSRGTLSNWFRGIPWSRHLSTEHSEKNRGASRDRMERLRMVRRLGMQYKYALIEQEAAKEYLVYKEKTLFWAGLMLYAGEGDMRSPGLIRLTNSQFYIHRLFREFAMAYLGVSREAIKHTLILTEGLNEAICKKVWVEKVGVPEGVFYKTQFIKGGSRVKRLQYGSGMSIISNTSLKRRLLVWLALAEEETFR